MNEAPRARVFVGAALPLLAFPLAVAAYAVFVSSDHRLDRTILVVWQDNQLAISVLAGVGLLATLGSSLLLFSGLRHSSAAMFGVIPLAGVISLLGVALATWTVRSSFVSPAAVSPVDAPFFVLAVVGEGLRVLGAALFVSFAILVSSGAAQVSLGDRPGLAGGLVSLVGAAAVAVSVQRMVALTDGINRTVHTETAAWTEFFVHETSEMGTSPVPMVALLVLSVVLAGAVLLRKQVRLLLPLFVLGVSAPVPAASLGLTLALVTSASRQLVPIPETRSLEPLRGRVTSGSNWVLGSRGITSPSVRGRLGTEFVERDLARRRFNPPTIAVEKGSRTDDLVSFLEAARRAGVLEVGLVGQSEVDLTGTASELRPLLEQIQSSARQVDLKLVGPEAEQHAQFVLTRTTSLEALLRSAEASTARFEPLVILLRP